ncbi:hypothetical protein F5884DRAFT_825037 [Xylogone sp. PMI_703]|nr:hypothetical protein F5884DRAFT_825037 [Xylogone sp. PMI_703]
MKTEAEAEQINFVVTLLYEVASRPSQEWKVHLRLAHATISALDRLRFFRHPGCFDEQIWIVQGFQDYAFHEADSGAIQDIAQWCQRAWLSVLSNHPRNIECLTGLGYNWLLSAQAILVRIYGEESRESCSGGSSQDGKLYKTAHNFQRQHINIGFIAQASKQSDNPSYVEARGYLYPALDFFHQAVKAADVKGSTNGDLLSLAADANISMGIVSGSPVDEQYFVNAICFLRRAQALPDYHLSSWLGRYLDEYGKYVN